AIAPPPVGYSAYYLSPNNVSHLPQTPKRAAAHHSRISIAEQPHSASTLWNNSADDEGVESVASDDDADVPAKVGIQQDAQSKVKKGSSGGAWVGNVISNGAPSRSQWQGEVADLQLGLQQAGMTTPVLVISCSMTVLPGFNMQRIVEHSLVRARDTVGIISLSSLQLLLLGTSGHCLARPADTVPVPLLAGIEPGSASSVRVSEQSTVSSGQCQRQQHSMANDLTPGCAAPVKAPAGLCTADGCRVMLLQMQSVRGSGLSSPCWCCSRPHWRPGCPRARHPPCSS
ncbi:uncharacterized protein HaLaN_20997, partial [Haematococcus lacustris]